MDTTRRTMRAPEVIATYFCCDISEVRSSQYQPSLLPSPAVYTPDGNDYYCCPTDKQKPPKVDRDGRDRGFVWKPVFEWRGRTVYESKVSDMEASEK